MEDKEEEGEEEEEGVFVIVFKCYIREPLLQTNQSIRIISFVNQISMIWEACRGRGGAR